MIQGNYTCRGQRIESDFVLENKCQQNDVQFLCSRLNEHSLGYLRKSILPVLGYRQPPYNQPDGTKIFQVVVELPASLRRSSLSHLLRSEPCPEERERLKLCQKLACATKVIHAIGLVHKALRPRAMLALRQSCALLSTAKVYPLDWSYAREISGATAELGEAVWSKRIYQHPARQGEYAEAKYETRHDIYCLGVGMLEVLLWKPFIIEESAAGQVVQLRICDLFVKYGFLRRENDGGLPERYQGDSARMTSRPWITQTIWQDIAKAELGNSELTKLVLKCLDGGFKTAEEVENRVEELIAPAQST